MMILKIAWKNIWRSKLRSLVIILSTTIGVWSLLFLLSWVFGLISGFINKSVDYRLSHLQVHDERFLEDNEIKYFFDFNKVKQVVDPTEIDGMSKRVVVNCMIQSPRAARGLKLQGVDPQMERGLTNVHELVKEGDYFETKTRNPIVISTSIADKLKVKLKSKVVASFQDFEGNISAGAFRVVGLYDSGDIKLDDMTAFVQISDLQRLIGIREEQVHEVALKLVELDSLDQVQSRLTQAISPLKVENYKELSPDLELYSSQIEMNVIIMTVIFMLALIFGIINSMLMAVLERTKELGMLMAIGMNKVRVFMMIVFETIMLSMIGVPLGLGLGYWTITYLNKRGMDLSEWSEGLRQFGMDQIVRPELDLGYYGFVAMAVAITALLASIYPSFKAISMKPVEALRKI